MNIKERSEAQTQINDFVTLPDARENNLKSYNMPTKTKTASMAMDTTGKTNSTVVVKILLKQLIFLLSVHLIARVWRIQMRVMMRMYLIWR